MREDLFQEGWLEAWQTEQREPDSPPTHLVRRAAERMVVYRRLGHSVDGKLNEAHERRTVYEVSSLDQPVRSSEDGSRSLQDVTPSRQHDVADEVVSLLHTLAFFATLQSLDQRILGLRLVGFRWSEIIHSLPLQPRALHARRAALRGDAKRHWDPNDD